MAEGAHMKEGSYFRRCVVFCVCVMTKDYSRIAVFLEQSFAESEHRGEHYAITGFNYKVSEGRLDSEGQGFQAVYTRKPDVRPEWKRFPLSISVRP